MNKAVFFILMMSVGLSITGHCDETISNEPIFLGVDVGASLINYRYTEPGLISHSGYLIDIFARVPMKLAPLLIGVLDSDIAVGSLDYNGSLCDTNTNVCTEYKAKTNDLIFKSVYRFNYLLSEQFEIYSGPGWRYRYDKGVGIGFYTRIGNYFFIPAGAKIKFTAFSSNFDFEFEYDFLFRGSMLSKVSEANSSFGDISHKQDNGHGTKFSLTYNSVSSKIFWIVTYENWYLAESNVEPLIENGLNSGKLFVEPKNFTDVVSVGVGTPF